jgi:hypothetical protein
VGDLEHGLRGWAVWRVAGDVGKQAAAYTRPVLGDRCMCFESLSSRHDAAICHRIEEGLPGIRYQRIQLLVTVLRRFPALFRCPRPRRLARHTSRHASP